MNELLLLAWFPAHQEKAELSGLTNQDKFFMIPHRARTR